MGNYPADNKKVKIEYLEAVEYLEHAEATTQYWTFQAMMPAGPSMHITQHLAQANEALNTAHSAILAIEARSPPTAPWMPDSPQHQEALILHQH
ncbi:uncharacterized protein EI90DRAFT_3130919 [Cantharellus anzutake]|uniref:uncharacterized protein n=1 Tax=Cantharellus anzutake TaxID=1750568 RepID=UPI001907BE31|nr:uncharacterized protein EI90DRAFT_3130919 [Cantharellus anzutake]KAF8322803.1 hypothetical protein EI90DRAFT_3130919 [Cantharellus anzutake]